MVQIAIKSNKKINSVQIAIKSSNKINSVQIAKEQ